MQKLFLWKFLPNLKNILLIAVVLSVSLVSTANAETTINSAEQQITVTGTVYDETGQTFPGVNIVIKGTATGRITDTNGRFSIDVPGESAVLIFSFIGYNPQEITVGRQRNLTINMAEDTKIMDEVVVVGYGTQRKATVTGSVVAVTNEQLTTTKNANTQNMLTGKLPGLRVIQKTSEPGQFNNQFDIRGLGSPLFVVDGVPRGDFPRMDGTDIESISILKDASAAVYGVRAANGVVLITTKSGLKQKASIEYTGYYGIQTPAEILNPARSYDRALLYNETTMRSTSNPQKQYSNEYLQDILDGKYPDTDWYYEVMRKTAPQQQHNISVRGGNEGVDYYVNLGYNNQGSFWKTNSTNYDRYNLRTNINVTVIDNLKASVRLNYIQDETYRQYYDATSIFKSLWRSTPIDPVFADGDGGRYYFHPTSGDIENVVPTIHPELSGFRSYKKDILQSNLGLSYDVPFVKGLKANFMFAYDKTFNDNTSYKKEFKEYRYNEATDSYSEWTRNAPTRLERSFSTNNSKLWNISLNYDNTFADAHHVGALILYEENYGQSYDFRAQRDFTIAIPYLFAGDPTNQIGNGSGLTENSNRAIVGRLNYDYMRKYLFEFSFRYDGSSKFPKNKQWGFFPSVQLGYVISEEPFIKDNVPFLDNLKFRGSWGKLGDDGASSFQFIDGYDYPASGGTTRPGGYVFGGQFTNALGFRNAPNMNITWFTSTMKNIGVDVDLWNRLLGFSFDLFQRDRDGLLATPAVVIPATFGSGISNVNFESDRNKGFEFEVRHRYNVSKDFNYNVSAFVSMTRSMWTKRIQSDYSNSYNYWRNNPINRYKDVWFGRGAAGVYQSFEQIANSIHADNGTLPGDPIYADWNGDGILDDDDVHPIATTTSPGGNFQDQRNYPLMNFGFTISAQYKWIDLTMHFQGSAMSYVSYGEQLMNPLSWDGNALPLMFDRWRPVDPDAHPYDPTNEWISGRFPYGKTRASTNSEFNIQKGDYLRLKNMEIGFTVPKNAVMDKLRISRMRLFANAYNLFTITNVIGLDPERPTESYGYMYPLNRTFNFGGTITF